MTKLKLTEEGEMLMKIWSLWIRHHDDKHRRLIVEFDERIRILEEKL